MKRKIILNFGELRCEGELFESAIAKRFGDILPVSVELTRWGDELYGPTGHDLGTENPVPEIPAGGIAYSQRGGYVCVFFGQTPAWPVDHIGRISDDEWIALKASTGINRVRIENGDNDNGI